MKYEFLIPNGLKDSDEFWTWLHENYGPGGLCERWLVWNLGIGKADIINIRDEEDATMFALRWTWKEYWIHMNTHRSLKLGFT